MATDTTVEQRLIANIKSQLPGLEALLARACSEWEYEDFVYRFYHQSFKVFGVQSITLEISDALRSLLPEVEMNRSFLAIVESGTGRHFTPETNRVWDAATRPFLEAFFHTRFMLEMAVKYGHELDSPPSPLPSGWAALLYLYGLR